MGHRGHLYQRQHLFHRGGDFRLWAVLHRQAEPDVLGDRQMREQRIILKDCIHRAPVRRQGQKILAAQTDLARRGVDEARNGTQERGLAAARRAKEREELIGADVDRHPIQRDKGAGSCAKADRDAIDFDHRKRPLWAMG